MLAGELGGDGAAKRMTVVGELARVDSEISQVIVSCLGIELRGRVTWRSSQSHVSAVLGQEHGIPRPLRHFARPVELPEGQVGVAVKAEQHTLGGFRITDEITRELLTIRRRILDASGLASGVGECRRLEENSFLSPPEQQQ